jgi:hypothetical protein
MLRDTEAAMKELSGVGPLAIVKQGAPRAAGFDTRIRIIHPPAR